jgi:hypothetical protein
MLSKYIKGCWCIKIFSGALIALMLIDCILASDVAYIYKKNYKVDKNILSVFNELGLSYDLINENYLPSNFSSYRIIFVGDERYNNPNKIPVIKKASIIANYYHGQEWGLTDYDGISKLAANDPLSVKKDGGIVQVYNKALYDGGIAVPYYYLDDKDKAPVMQTVARTYTGDGDQYDFGDVISYAYPRGNLTDGNKNKEKVCFFGIIESNYWTPAARQMFKDCASFVAMACEKDSDCGKDETGDRYCENKKIYQDVSSFKCANPGKVDSKCEENKEKKLIEECKDLCVDGECKDVACYKDEDCNDNNLYTEDVCKNPGAANSYCEHIPLSCIKDSDCGADGYIGNKYCTGKDVYQDYVDYKCLNNSCQDSTIPKLIQECNDACRNGTCVEIECSKDSDCPNDYSGSNYCQNNSVLRDFHDFSCKNEICVENISMQLIEECSDACVNGNCEGIQCSKNSDCGKNNFLGSKYCKNGNAFEDYISYTCFNPGKTNSYCEDYTLPILVNYCEGECISGECITCFNNLSCGNSGFTGDKYCSGKDVYQDYKEFECINPATAQSDCLSEASQKLIEECSDACVNGMCKKIACYKDEDCNDSNLYTFDECNNPGTFDSYCTNTKINCITNNDCGISGFFGLEFCSDDDLYKYYGNGTCIKPKTKESHCETETFPRLIKDCGAGSCGNWTVYCKENDIYKKRDCYEKGCEEASCFAKLTTQDEKVKSCEYGCFNGECSGECGQDSDCSDGYYCNGEEKCSNGNCVSGTAIDCGVFDIQEIATCNNIPDNNSLTWDYFAGFGSECDENSDSCTVSQAVTDSNCSINKCNAECETNADCPEKCTSTHKLYTTSKCEGCKCKYSGYKCVKGKCGAECEKDSDCKCRESYCNGTTLINYTEYETCGTSGDSACLCSTCQPVLILDSPLCGYVEPECGDGKLDTGEECDDGNNANGDGCSPDCKFEILCYKNSDCGTDGWQNQDYCECGSDVWDFWTEYTCINPGEINAKCDSSANPELKQDCGEDYCENTFRYCIEKQVWENKTCYDKGCKDAVCFSNKFVNKTLVEACDYGCEDGSCIDECSKDEDCHDDYYGKAYCMNNDSYRDFHDFSCVDGACKEDIKIQLKSDCGESECEEWSYYCQCSELWKKRSCNNKGCNLGECYSDNKEYKELVDKCKFWCIDGKCMDFQCNNSFGCSGWNFGC